MPQRNVELGLWWVVSWHLYQVQCMPQGEFPPGRVLRPGRHKVHRDCLHNTEHLCVRRTLLQHQRRKQRGKVRNVPHWVAGIWVGLYPVPSCNEKGIPLCGGDCSVKFYPRCELESNFVECLPCTESLPNNSVLTLGGVLDRADACSTYITCNTGYVLTYNQNDVLDQFNLTCTPCLVA